MLDRVDDPLSHRRRVELEGRVHAGDHPVELGQEPVAVVERAIGQDVDLAPREQLDPVDVHRTDLFDVLAQPFR